MLLVRIKGYMRTKITIVLIIKAVNSSSFFYCNRNSYTAMK